MTPKAQATKDKMDFKGGGGADRTSKNTMNRLKRKCTESEKIFANNISGKRWPSRIFRELLNLRNKTPNNLTQKMGQGLKPTFRQIR